MKKTKLVVDCRNCGNCMDIDLLNCPICKEKNKDYTKLPSLYEAIRSGDKRMVDWLERKAKQGQIINIIG